MAIRVKLLLFGLWASCLSCLHEFVRSQLCIVHYALCIVHCALCIMHYALKNCSCVPTLRLFIVFAYSATQIYAGDKICL